MLRDHPVLVSAPICVHCRPLHCSEPGWKWGLPPWRHRLSLAPYVTLSMFCPFLLPRYVYYKHVIHQSHKSVLLGNSNDTEESKLFTLATTLIVAFKMFIVLAFFLCIYILTIFKKWHYFLTTCLFNLKSLNFFVSVHRTVSDSPKSLCTCHRWMNRYLP